MSDMCPRRERRNDLLVAACAARTNRSASYTSGQHDAALDRLLADLGLTDLEQSRVGGVTPDDVGLEYDRPLARIGVIAGEDRRAPSTGRLRLAVGVG